jgi:thiosulfate/3-mercaptopyruvate sulfurtransferase
MTTTRPSPLIPVRELAERMSNGPSLVLLDARASADAYGQGHLENAVRADANRDLSSASAPRADPAMGGRHPLPSLDHWAATLGSWGITPATDVVVYDEADGSNAAARAWWMLRSAGHEGVRVLDGGFAAAVAAGIRVTTVPPVVTPVEPYPVHAWERPLYSIEQVDALRQNSDWKVLDVRSAPRYRGETEPIDPVAGHIPGAVNLPFSENMHDGVFKEPAALREQYLELLGDTPSERLIVHCGSGITACHTLLALELAGLDGAGLYVGSWSEWCRR